MKRSNGIAAGDALLMHCALLDRAPGTTGFVMLPMRQRLDSSFVRFGNPGELGFSERGVFVAARVISDLLAELPDPKSH